jgi:hypothetical protein
MKTIPDPPRLSTFKRRGGGGSGIAYAAFRRPRSRRPDQRRSCSPALLSCPVLNQCGPSPVMSSPFPPFPCCRVSSIHLPSLVHVVLPSSHHPLVACHVSRSFPRQPLTRRRIHFSRLPPFHLMSSAMNHPPSSFSHLVTSSTPSNPTPPFLSCAHPPRWPPCLSLKLFSYSRWQREKSSISRSAELAGPFSIPRSSY